MEKPKILYIDDDEGILISAKFLICDICDLTTEPSPKKAIELLKSFTPDIIFLDITIPEWDGIEVLKVIRQNYPNIPVFMVSGWVGGSEKIDQARALGARGLIAKPFAKDDIKRQIDTVINKPQAQ